MWRTLTTELQNNLYVNDTYIKTLSLHFATYDPNCAMRDVDLDISETKGKLPEKPVFTFKSPSSKGVMVIFSILALEIIICVQRVESIFFTGRWDSVLPL